MLGRHKKLGCRGLEEKSRGPPVGQQGEPRVWLSGSPETQILILTAMDDQELVFMALEAGADGYRLKRSKPVDLLRGVAGRGARRRPDDKPGCSPGH